MKHVFLTIVVFIVILFATACQMAKSDLDRAKETVLSWFTYYCDNPFSPHPDKPGLQHEDYWNIPGVEGTHISIVSRRIEIVEATYFVGDRTLYKTREEKLVRVVARLKQLYFIDDGGAKKAEKPIEMTFYPSRYGTPKGEYLILNNSPLDYDIYFDDAIQKYLNKAKGPAFLALKQSLIKAGMQGLP